MSYYRDHERYDCLPTIRRSGMYDLPPRRGLTTVDDMTIHDDRNVRFRDRDSPVFYPRPPSPTQRRQQIELQEQLRLAREESMKKDRLIARLSSHEGRTAGFGEYQFDDVYASGVGQLSAGATTSAVIKGDLAAAQVRVDSLQSQVRETQSQLNIKEEKLRELRTELDQVRESEAKATTVVQSLRQRLAQYESTSGSYEGMASKTELTVTTLQRENRESREKVVELETRMRSYLEERENMDRELNSIKRRYEDVVAQFNSAMHIDDSDAFIPTTPDTLAAKLTDILQENAVLKGKMLAMRDHVQSAELETKASRETIMRLVSESEREQKTQSRYTLDMDALRIERDNALARQRDLEREIESMNERVDSMQRAWNNARRELEDQEGRMRGAQDLEVIAKTSEQSARLFKESLATLLSDSYCTVEPYEERIRERITSLMHNLRDKSAHIDMLEGKISSVTEELQRQHEGQRQADRRAKRVEADIADMEERLRRSEGEASAGDVLRDGLRVDKERYLRFLERVTHALRMDPIASDIGLDMACDAIIARCEQLVRSEGDSLVDRKTHIYNLQRKVKSQKEQLESKELHMDLLRKKVASLEERMIGRSDLEREKDGEALRSRKVVKLAEKYKRELEEAYLEIRALKARILESSDMRSQTLEAEREIENLESKVGQLERVREKQAKKIGALKESVDVTSGELDQKKEVARGTIMNLTSELRTTKAALEELTRRERQLLDLRSVIARMLGLDVSALAIPDYEIINCLEKLILAHQSNTVTSAALSTAVDDMEDGFRAGYRNAGRVLATAPVALVRSRSAHRSRPRARSLSPSRRRDTRAY